MLSGAPHPGAQSLLREEWLPAGLRELKSKGKALWDGREKLSVRNASGVEASQLMRESKRLHVAGDDLPIVYLVPSY